MKSNKRKTMVVLVIALFVASAVSLLPLSSAQETTVSIGDGSAAPDEEAIVSVMINNVPVDIMTADVTLTYNGSIVHVTSVDNSQFDNCLSTINNITGSTRICAYQSESDPLTGNVKLCDITLKAVGSAGESSPLNITVGRLEALGDVAITAVPSNGTVSITSVPQETTTPKPSPSTTPDSHNNGGHNGMSGNVTDEETPTTPTPAATTTATPGVSFSPSPTSKPLMPGFEAVFAIVSLLSVTYLIFRKRTT